MLILTLAPNQASLSLNLVWALEYETIPVVNEKHEGNQYILALYQKNTG